MRPYKIMKRIEKVIYELDLPIELALVHLVSHMLIFRKYLGDPNAINSLKVVTIEENLTHEEVTIEIFDWQIKRLRKKKVAHVKVLCRN